MKWARISGRCGYCAFRIKENSASADDGIAENGRPTLRAASTFRPFEFLRAAAVGLYISDAPKKGAFGRLVSDFKYNGNGGPDLAEALHLALPKRFPDVRFDLLVPVPPEPGNERDAPLELARLFGSLRGSKVVRALSLAPGYKSNKNAGRAEKFNATKGQFRVADEAAFSGQRVGLVDDVMTTGGHVHWATRALVDRGAAAVTVLVLARTFDVASLEALGYRAPF